MNNNEGQLGEAVYSTMLTALGRRLQHGLHSDPTKLVEICPPEGLETAMFEDCVHAADVMREALRNKFSMSWRLRDHINAVPKVNGIANELEQARLERDFPAHVMADCGIPHAIHSAAVIVDADQMPLAWALPNLLRKSRHDELLEATQKLKKHLDKPTASTSSWRLYQQLFNDHADGGCGLFGIVPQMRPRFSSVVRASRAFETDEVQCWLKSIDQIGAILDAVLRILAPNQHEQVGELFRDNVDAAFPWPVTSIGLQIVFNRKTPYHRDVNTFKHWCDLLVTLGTYGHSAYMGLRGLGYSVPYTPGTAVVILANVIEHGVPEVDETRIVVSWYNRRDMVKIWGGEDISVAPSETVQAIVVRVLHASGVYVS